LRHIHEQLLQPDELLHHVEHGQLHVADDEILAPILADIVFRIVVASLGQRIGEREGCDVLRRLYVAERPVEDLHVERPLAHRHLELVDDVAVGIGGMLIPARQARADHDAVAAHRHAQVIVRQPARHILVVRGRVVCRDAVSLRKAVGQAARQVELERDPVGESLPGKRPDDAFSGVHVSSSLRYDNRCFQKPVFV